MSIQDELEIIYIPLGELVCDPQNAREHPKGNIEWVKESLRTHGQRKPIVIARDGKTIIAGNGVFQAARELSWTRIACVISPLSGPSAAAYAISDNRAGERSSWDMDQLVRNIQSIINDLDGEFAENVSAAIGFTDSEIDAIYHQANMAKDGAFMDAISDLSEGENSALSRHDNPQEKDSIEEEGQRTNMGNIVALSSAQTAKVQSAISRLAQLTSRAPGDTLADGICDLADHILAQ